jgi:hypothetical protein
MPRGGTAINAGRKDRLLKGILPGEVSPGGFKYPHAAITHPLRRGPTPIAQNEPAMEPSAMTAASATRAPMMPTTTMSR